MLSWSGLEGTFRRRQLGVAGAGVGVGVGVGVGDYYYTSDKRKAKYKGIVKTCSFLPIL